MKFNTTPITLIGGYLGSGKTTLINHLLGENKQLKIAVLVNDFGDLAIDAQLIESTKGNIISLNGGCVCCSYGNDLSNAILEVLALHPAPDHIVIEASGVALPGSIASSLSLINGITMHAVVIIANAETLKAQSVDRFVGDTIQRQLYSADLLVLNKIDLVNDTELYRTQAWLQKILPAVKQICTRDSHLPSAILLGEDIVPTARYHSDQPLTHASLFSTFSINILKRVDPDALSRLLTQDRFRLVRAKGFVKNQTNEWSLIQVVGGRWQTSAAPKHLGGALIGGLVCIGLTATLDKQELENAIKLL